MMTVVVVFEENVLSLIFGYAPQSGRSLEENCLFMMKRELDMHRAGD